MAGKVRFGSILATRYNDPERACVGSAGMRAVRPAAAQADRLRPECVNSVGLQNLVFYISF